MAGLQSGKGYMMIDSVIWAQYINVTDRQPRHHSKCHSNALCRVANTARNIKDCDIKNFKVYCYLFPRIEGTKKQRNSNNIRDFTVGSRNTAVAEALLQWHSTAYKQQY